MAKILKPLEGTYSDEEIARRSDAALQRLLSTPPQPKPKKADDASPPKKRGRPPKTKAKPAL